MTLKMLNYINGLMEQEAEKKRTDKEKAETVLQVAEARGADAEEIFVYMQHVTEIKKAYAEAETMLNDFQAIEWKS